MLWNSRESSGKPKEEGGTHLSPFGTSETAWEKKCTIWIYPFQKLALFSSVPFTPSTVQSLWHVRNLNDCLQIRQSLRMLQTWSICLLCLLCLSPKSGIPIITVATIVPRLPCPVRTEEDQRVHRYQRYKAIFWPMTCKHAKNAWKTRAKVFNFRCDCPTRYTGRHCELEACDGHGRLDYSYWSRRQYRVKCVCDHTFSERGGNCECRSNGGTYVIQYNECVNTWR